MEAPANQEKDKLQEVSTDVPLLILNEMPALVTTTLPKLAPEAVNNKRIIKVEVKQVSRVEMKRRWVEAFQKFQERIIREKQALPTTMADEVSDLTQILPVNR